MREELTVTGIILYATLLNEYDKRLVILTKERGKITVFANGARRLNSSIRAASQSYVMGTFTVRQSRDAYTLVKAEVDEYFIDLQKDMEKMCYAAYFCELMAYYLHEGDACTNHLNLLYLTFKALLAEQLPIKQIKCVYELRLMHLEGQGMHSFSCVKCDEKQLTHFDARLGGLLCESCAAKWKVDRRVSGTLVYTLQYVATAPLAKLYHFALKEDALIEFEKVTGRFMEQYVDKKFKSLEILSSLA